MHDSLYLCTISDDLWLNEVKQRIYLTISLTMEIKLNIMNMFNRIRIMQEKEFRGKEVKI